MGKILKLAELRPDTLAGSGREVQAFTIEPWAAWATVADRVGEIQPADIPALLGELERLKALLWARLLAPPALTAGASPPTPEAERPLTAKAAAAGRSQEAGGLLTQRDAAAFLGVSPRTLEGWRVRGGGPRFVRVGRAVRYRREDLEQYLHECTRRSTSEDAVA